MAANINLKTFVLTLIAVLGSELIGRRIILLFPEMIWPMLTGLRLFQIALMLAIVRAGRSGLASIGLSPETWPKGVKTGVIWSICFGAATAISCLLYTSDAADE